MPCAKGMTRCKPSCLHRECVLEYRATRQASVLDQEARTSGGASDLSLLREGGWHPMTFKRWLRGQRFRSLPPEEPEPQVPLQVWEGW